MSSTGLPTPPHPRSTVDGNKLFTEERSAEVVAASFAGTPDPRLRQVLTSLVHHLHAFVKDVELTEEEWGAAIDFLTRTGQMCDDVRQEFILLSDVLGRLDAGRDDQPPHRRDLDGVHGAGPVPHGRVPAARARRRHRPGRQGRRRAWSPGRVTGPDGEPIAGATVDVWQANEDGFYDVQQPGIQPERNLRGLFTADDDGRFWFRTIVPRHYPIPVRRPGRRAARGHRPAPQPARRTCTSSCPPPGYRPVTTHVFVAGHPVPRLRRGLRGQGEPGPRVRPRSTTRPGPPSSVGQPVPHACTFDVTPAARRPSDGRGCADEPARSPTRRCPCGCVFGAGSLASSPDEVDRPRALPGAGAVLPGAGGHRACWSPRRSATGPPGCSPEARMHVPIEVARRARDRGRELGADGCVAVGGGSAIGLGKAIALEHGLPVIAVPTTYAGSEMTPVWGLTEGGRKRTGRDPRVLPRSVVYDPELTLTLPAGAVGDQRHERHRARRRRALRPRRHPDHLADGRGGRPGPGRRAARGGRRRRRPRRARPRPSTAPGCAGRCWPPRRCRCTTSCATPSAAPSTCRTPQTHTVVLPHALAYNQPAAPEAVAALSRALGGAPDPARELWELAGRLGAPRSLRELGMAEADIAAHRRPAVANPYANPRPVTRDGLELLLPRRMGRRPAHLARRIEMEVNPWVSGSLGWAGWGAQWPAISQQPVTEWLPTTLPFLLTPSRPTWRLPGSG